MQTLTKVPWFDVGVGALIFVFSLVFSVGVASIVLKLLPSEYFVGDFTPRVFFAGRAPWLRAAAHIGKNILGVLLVLLGVLLSLPGVPGQGVLTILIGLTLIDFRGKRRIEQRIMRIPAVFRGANAIRARFGKEPFVQPEPASSEPTTASR